MEQSADVGQTGLQTVLGGNELGVVGVEQIQHLLGPAGGEGPQQDLLLDAEDAHRVGPGLPAGVDQGLGLRDGDVRLTALGADGGQELQGAAGPAGVEDHDLPVRQGGITGLGDHFVGEGGGDHHDQVDAPDRLGHICGDQVHDLVGGLPILGQVDAAGGLNGLQILGKQVAQVDLDAPAGQITGNGGPTVSGPDDSNSRFHKTISFLIKYTPSPAPGANALCARGGEDRAYRCCSFAFLFQKNRRRTSTRARAAPQKIRPV